MFAKADFKLWRFAHAPIDIKNACKGAMIPFRPDLDGEEVRLDPETDMLLQLESPSGFCEQLVVGVGGIELVW